MAVVRILAFVLLALLLAYPLLLILGVSLPHLLLNRRFFGRTPGRRAAFDGLTTIVPLRGTSPSLADNLASHLRHPPPAPFRLVLCLESEDDPAHAAAVAQDTNLAFTFFRSDTGDYEKREAPDDFISRTAGRLFTEVASALVKGGLVFK